MANVHGRIMSLHISMVHALLPEGIVLAILREENSLMVTKSTQKFLYYNYLQVHHKI